MLSIEQRQPRLEQLLQRIKQERLKREQRQPRLEQLLQRLKQARLKREQRQPRLERMKCLLEKQHRFNSKMPSIEQQKPRRDLPLNKLAIVTSRSSFALRASETEAEQETRFTSNDSCLLLVDDPTSSKCLECFAKETLAWSLS